MDKKMHKKNIFSSGYNCRDFITRNSWITNPLIVEAFTLNPRELVSDFEKENDLYVRHVYVPESNIVSVTRTRDGLGLK